MNPDLDKLHPYPFEKLARLKQGVTPPAGLDHIPLSIGEPRHPAPSFVHETLISHLHGLSDYPLTRGSERLRETIATWLERRFGLPVNGISPERHVLPVNGTREALFAIAQCLVDRGRKPLVMMPNPFYQIYEGAALLAGAEPWYLNTTRETGFLPDLDAVPASAWTRCQLLYLCSPGNPSGAVMPLEALQHAIELAERHDFVIVSDECYSEIYPHEDQPPPGLLQAAVTMGNHALRRCLVFHSLSKRSNLPGLRSGFVAGDAELIERFLRYRTYHGCAMPPPTQHASIAAWSDEEHVRRNREAYREKFSTVLGILDDVLEIPEPQAGFYLWPRTPVADDTFALGLFERYNVTVLPGSYLSREAQGINPGSHHIRIALVAALDECVDAAQRIRQYCIDSFSSP